MKTLKVLATATVAAAVLSTGAVSASAAAEVKTQAGVEFEPSTEAPGTRDPYNPDEGVTPDPIIPGETIPDPKPGDPNGYLTLDYASSLYFGSNSITAKDMTYHAYPVNVAPSAGSLAKAGERPNYVQVTDYRGNHAGWKLTLAQDTQLTAKTSGIELQGASITLGASTLVRETGNASTLPATFTTATPLVPGSSNAIAVMTAAATAADETPVGQYTTIAYFDNDETIEDMSQDTDFGSQYTGNAQVKRNKSVSLFVPGSSVKEHDQYRAGLTWTLTDAPS